MIAALQGEGGGGTGGGGLVLKTKEIGAIVGLKTKREVNQLV